MGDRAKAIAAAGTEAFARTVRAATDEELEDGLATVLRGIVLREVFGRMETDVRPQRIARVDAVVHWKLLDRDGTVADHWEVVIRGGVVRVSEAPVEPARVTLTIGGADFLRLVVGEIGGPGLVVTGRLRVRGSYLFAMRIPSMFRTPSGAID